MSCKVNEGMHVFATTPAQEGAMIGNKTHFWVKSWHTCIACGERRALTEWGELIIKVGDDWEVRTS